jgi:hypothetical protein
MMMAEYTLIPKATLQAVVALNDTLKLCRSEIANAEASGDEMIGAMITASAMEALRQQLTPAVMKDVRSRVGSPLGIEVYPPTAKHSDDVVRDVVLEGLLQGARIVGGEIGIHSGRCYLTKKYWERKFRTLPGIVCDEPVLGKPRAEKVGDKEYAVVQAVLTWRMNGKSDKLECTNNAAISVIWNAGMQIDAIHGKVKRRLFKAGYAKVTNTQLEDDEEIVIDSPAGYPETLHTEPVAGYVVDSPGDEIAADAEQHLAEQTPEPNLQADWEKRVRDCKPEEIDIVVRDAMENDGIDVRAAAKDRKDAIAFKLHQSKRKS